MQGLGSDKTFHLKWNNHLQNLSQLFTTIYSSSALADVTLSCRDGTLKAHKLVLSACSPYFEQIFKDNPCQHPIVILKGIPFSEINLLVEFMYKGSVDVQELDLQSLMHTASELEIRGLAYEARDNAAQLLNVNLEYPTYNTSTPIPATSTPPQHPQSYPQNRTDVERLKQIHMYQQSMMRAEEIRRRRRDEPGTHTVVNNILAAAAREMEEARIANRDARVASIQTDHHADQTGVDLKRDPDDDRPKKRVSILCPDDERLKAKKKMTVRFQDDLKNDERPNKSSSPGSSNSDSHKNDNDSKTGGIKVVQLSALQKPVNNDNEDSDGLKAGMDDDEETDSSGSISDSATNDNHDGRPHVCDICEQRFQRASHLSRHRLTHTGERPFTCGGCGRSFARSDKLRVHTKICERVRNAIADDPTVDMATDAAGATRRDSCEVMSGTVRATHRESGHLVFTPGGDVTLPPRPAPTTTVTVPPPPPRILNATLDAQDGEPPRRGRGRPRKTPLPLTPKIQKRRGRPPKTSLDMEGCVLTGGTLGPRDHQLSLVPSSQQLLLKRKRGRPPKNYFNTSGDDVKPSFAINFSEVYGRPNENYNASNLPFGDFSYLTEMMYNPALPYSFGVTSSEPERAEPDQSVERTHESTIDVSDPSTDDDEQRLEPEDNVPSVGVETQIMTVGDCQIVKLPATEDNAEKIDQPHETVSSSTPNSVTITPITTVGDCTIRPVDNNS